MTIHDKIYFVKDVQLKFYRMASNVLNTMKYERLLDNKELVKDAQEQKTVYKKQLVWWNVTFMSYIHLTAIYGLYLSFQVKYWTILWCMYFIHFYYSTMPIYKNHAV